MYMLVRLRLRTKLSQFKENLQGTQKNSSQWKDMSMRLISKAYSVARP